MLKVMIVSLAFGLVLCGWSIARDKQDALARCEVNHTIETCLHVLR